ncbi:MAG: hypothetical protein AAFU85_34525, partial [Planctomycetota bacterium]
GPSRRGRHRKTGISGDATHHHPAFWSPKGYLFSWLGVDHHSPRGFLNLFQDRRGAGSPEYWRGGDATEDSAR